MSDVFDEYQARGIFTNKQAEALRSFSQGPSKEQREAYKELVQIINEIKEGDE